MCRLFAITSKDPLSPMVAIRALDVMKEGHDGSGVGLFLTDLGGDFEQFKGEPILSGIFSNDGIKALDRYMMDLDFMVKYKLSIRPTKTPPAGNAETGQLPDPGVRISAGLGVPERSGNPIPPA